MRQPLLAGVAAILLLLAVGLGQSEPEAVLHGAGGVAVGFSTDGRRIFTAGRETARIWNGQTFRPQSDPMRHGGDILFADLSADGRRAITAGKDRTVCVWDATTGKRLTSLVQDADICSAAISADGSHVLVGEPHDHATLWDAATGRKLFDFRVSAPRFANPAPGPVSFVTFTPDGANASTVRENGGSYLWDVKTGKKRVTRDSDQGCVAFSRNGKLAVSRAADWLVCLWDVGTGDAVAAFDARPGEEAGFLEGGVSTVASAPDNKTFAAAGAAVGLWQVHGGKAELIGKNYLSGVAADLQFSPDGTRYVLAAEGEDTGIFDVQPPRQILRIGRKGQPPPVIAYSPDGRHVATACLSDDSTSVWEVPDEKH